MRFARSGDRKDDMFDAVIAPLKMISSEHLVICKAKAESDNPDAEIAVLTVRDTYSGIVMTHPGKEKDTRETVIAYNHFVGGKQEEIKPRVVVKSDNAPALIEAAHNLAWIPELSLANRWPHNAVHERMHRTLLSLCRSHLKQSGMPSKIRNIVVCFASVLMSVIKNEPKVRHEVDALNESRAAYKDKHNSSCWKVHTGNDFSGIIQPFGLTFFTKTPQRSIQWHRTSHLVSLWDGS